MSAAAPAPAPKKKMSGCLIAIIVVGGLTVLVVVLAAVGALKVLSSSEGQKIVRFVGDSAKMMEEAQRAPGTQELRAKGCMQAMVVDMDRMASLVKDLSPDAGDLPPGGERELVSCTVDMFGTAPECDALATAYVAAASPKRPFRVTVQKQGGQRAECTKVYTAEGAAR